MAFPYQIGEDRGLVTISYESPVTFDRWRATMDRVLADPRFRPGFSFLGDRRAIESAVSSEHVEAEVTYMVDRRAHLGQGRWANLVHASNKADYGMGRMSEILAELKGTLPVRTFDRLEDALAWLEERM